MRTKFLFISMHFDVNGGIIIYKCEQTVDTSTKAECALTVHFHVPV